MIVRNLGCPFAIVILLAVFVGIIELIARVPMLFTIIGWAAAIALAGFVAFQVTSWYLEWLEDYEIDRGIQPTTWYPQYRE